MARNTSITASEFEALIHIRDALQTAPHGSKSQVIEQACLTLNCDSNTVYVKLKQAGFEAGRKRRVDAGDSLVTEEQLRGISGLLTESTRNNGKQLLTVGDAIDVMHANGKINFKPSASHVSRLLYQHTLHPSQLLQQTAATSMRSLHPNHVWQVDASVCVLYYLRDGHLRTMPKEEFYKNKPQNLVKVVNDLVTRYAITDHTSGVIMPRYYLGGETAANLIDVFLWAISKREGCPFYGVPLKLMMDPGSANTSGTFRNVLKRLDVVMIINTPGNARAKGQVENAHNLIERHFEGLLRFMPRPDLADLNSMCERWANAYNAEKRHSRHGKPRFEAWLRITAEQLRIPPAIDLLRDLATTEPVTRRVENDMTISYALRGQGSRYYDVRYVPGASPGLRVSVVVNTYKAPAVDIEFVDPDTKETRWMTIEPKEQDSNGFFTSAPVIDETYHAMPATTADSNRNQVGREAYRGALDNNLPSLDDIAKARKRREVAYSGELDAMAHIDSVEVPTYIPKRGQELQATKRVVECQRLSWVDAAHMLKERLGPHYTKEIFAWLQTKFPQQGVPEDQIEGIASQFTPATTTQADNPAGHGGLRVISGGNT